MSPKAIRFEIARLAGLLAHKRGNDSSAKVLETIAASLRSQARSALQ